MARKPGNEMWSHSPAGGWRVRLKPGGPLVASRVAWQEVMGTRLPHGAGVVPKDPANPGPFPDAWMIKSAPGMKGKGGMPARGWANETKTQAWLRAHRPDPSLYTEVRDPDNPKITRMVRKEVAR